MKTDISSWFWEVVSHAWKCDHCFLGYDLQQEGWGIEKVFVYMLEWSIFIAKELQIYVYPYAYVQRERESSSIQGSHSIIQFGGTSGGHIVYPQIRVNTELRPGWNLPSAFHWQGCHKVGKDSWPASSLNFAFPATVCSVQLLVTCRAQNKQQSSYSSEKQS